MMQTAKAKPILLIALGGNALIQNYVELCHQSAKTASYCDEGMAGFLEEGPFSKGSILPKVEAAI
jgi:carbamate kinase